MIDEVGASDFAIKNALVLSISYFESIGREQVANPLREAFHKGLILPSDVREVEVKYFNRDRSSDYSKDQQKEVAKPTTRVGLHFVPGVGFLAKFGGRTGVSYVVIDDHFYQRLTHCY